MIDDYDSKDLGDVEQRLRSDFAAAASSEKPAGSRLRRLVAPVAVLCAFAAVPAGFAIANALDSDDGATTVLLDENFEAIECPNGEELAVSDAEQEAVEEQLDAGTNPSGSEVPQCADGSVPEDIVGYREFGGEPVGEPSP